MTHAPDKATLRRFANSPAAFRDALLIQGARGKVPFRDIIAPFQRERFAALDPAFLAVAKGEQPKCGRFWWEATKGASKDTDLAISLLWLLAFTGRHGLVCQVGAADADQADELRKAAKGILRVNPWLAQQITIQTSTIVCQRTDSTCEIIPADLAGSHGARPDVLILNELHVIRVQEFADNLLDNAAKVPFGVVVIATNAGFENSWQWQWRETARTSPRWTFHKFDKPAPWLSEADIAERRRSSTAARFNRLWRGIWCSDAGDAINGEDIDAALTLAGPQAQADPTLHYVAGIDLGLKHDQSAITVLAANPAKRRIELAHVESWKAQPKREVDLRSVLAGIRRIHGQFHPRCWYFDPWQAALMTQYMRAEHIRVEEMPFSARNLDRMATALVEVFQSRSIALYDDPELLADIRGLQMEERGKYWRLAMPRNERGHSDRGTSFVLCLPAVLDLLKCSSFEPPRFAPNVPRNNFGPIAGNAKHRNGVLLAGSRHDRDHINWTPIQ
jgi:hypothetical protein